VSDNTTPESAAVTTPDAGTPESRQSESDVRSIIDNIEFELDGGASDDFEDDEQQSSDDDEAQETTDEDSDTEQVALSEDDDDSDSELNLAIPLDDSSEDEEPSARIDSGESAFDISWVDDARENLSAAIESGDKAKATQIAKGLEKRLRQFAPFAQEYHALDARLSQRETAEETMNALMSNLRRIHGDDFMAGTPAEDDNSFSLWGDEYDSAEPANKRSVVDEFLKSDFGKEIAGLLEANKAERERRDAAERQAKESEALRKQVKEKMPQVAQIAAKTWPGFELTSAMVEEAVVSYPSLAKENILTAVRAKHGSAIERHLAGVKSGRDAKSGRPGLVSNQRATTSTARVLTFKNVKDAIGSIEL